MVQQGFGELDRIEPVEVPPEQMALFEIPPAWAEQWKGMPQ